jgi:hypothetical protein
MLTTMFMVIKATTSQFIEEPDLSHNLGHQSNAQTFPPANNIKSKLQKLKAFYHSSIKIVL